MFRTIILSLFCIFISSLRADETCCYKDIPTHMAVTRNTVETLAKCGNLVSKRIDQLFTEIYAIYCAGEGFGERDVHEMLFALSYAAKKHLDQKTQEFDHEPFIVYVMGVTYNLLTVGRVRDPDIIIASILYKIPDFAKTPVGELRDRFGMRIGGIIAEMHIDAALPPCERDFLLIYHAPNRSSGATQLILADELYKLNMLMCCDTKWDECKIKEYFYFSQKLVSCLPWVNACLKYAVDQAIEGYFYRSPPPLGKIKLPALMLPLPKKLGGSGGGGGD